MRRERKINYDSAFAVAPVSVAPIPASHRASPGRTDAGLDSALCPEAPPAAADDAAEWKSMMAIALASEALALPDVRLDKVAVVQSALANGSYNIHASELASKVIDSMVESRKKMDDEPDAGAD